MSKFAVGLMLSKHDGVVSMYSHSLHVNDAASPAEAIGLALLAAEKLKPGYSASDPCVMNLETGESHPPQTEKKA